MAPQNMPVRAKSDLKAGRWQRSGQRPSGVTGCEEP